MNALKTREKILGKNHPDYATSLNNLAGLYRARGNYSKAELLYLETLKITKKVLGKNHPDYAGSFNNLAALYYAWDNYSNHFIWKSLKLAKKCWAKTTQVTLNH